MESLNQTNKSLVAAFGVGQFYRSAKDYIDIYFSSPLNCHEKHTLSKTIIDELGKALYLLDDVKIEINGKLEQWEPPYNIKREIKDWLGILAANKKSLASVGNETGDD